MARRTCARVRLVTQGRLAPAQHARVHLAHTVEPALSMAVLSFVRVGQGTQERLAPTLLALVLLARMVVPVLSMAVPMYADLCF